MPGVNEQVSIERSETLLQMLSDFNGDVMLASDDNVNYRNIEKHSKIRVISRMQMGFHHNHNATHNNYAPLEHTH